MSILMTDPGFGRGETLGVKAADQGGSVTGTTKAFLDTDPRKSRAGEFLSNRPVHCIAARNVSGSPLLPGTVVAFKDSNLLEEVSGAAATAKGLLGVVDEYLPASGCANLDVCWIVVSGPTAILTTASLAAGAALTSTAGKAAASASAADIVGYALKAPADGKIRAIVGTTSIHSAF